MPAILQQCRAANLRPVLICELTLEGQEAGLEGVLVTKSFFLRLSTSPQDGRDKIASHAVHSRLDPKGFLSAFK